MDRTWGCFCMKLSWRGRWGYVMQPPMCLCARAFPDCPVLFLILCVFWLSLASIFLPASHIQDETEVVYTTGLSWVMITRKENFYKILNHFYATLFAFSSVSFTPMQIFMTDGRAGGQHIASLTWGGRKGKAPPMRSPHCPASQSRKLLPQIRTRQL